MKLLLLCGSLRAGSTNEAVLRTAQQVALPGVDTTFYAGLAALPHFNPDDDHEPLPSVVAELRAAVRDADALVICTPEYAGDMPGSLKNLLDWTVGGVETEQKPVAWINASTSPNGASRTHDMLRIVLTYTGCEIVNEACVNLPVPRTAIDDGVVTDPALRAEVSTVLDTLTVHINRSRPGGNPPKP
jgi:chromate reductase, NAD(P)H dehydrogenase (quinone)